MIRYALKCSSDHIFDSWFQSAQAYDTLVRTDRVNCPICGVSAVEKSLMAPSVRAARQTGVTVPEDRQLAAAGSDVEAAMAVLRKQIEENSDYVGLNFAAEARRIHDGDAPERSIYGEARPEEARALLEDGVRVAPLPFVPGRKTN